MVLAIDGRSASGKSSLATLLAAAATAVGDRCAVVHTDDVAWWEPYFGWASLLADGVLRPARAGAAVRFRPPAWERRGRAGAIELPSGLDLVVVEGVGAGDAAFADLVDALVWVQSGAAEAERRGIARDVADGANGSPDECVAFWHTWMAEELPYLSRSRPWERAASIVCGTPDAVLSGDALADGVLLVADGLLGPGS